MAARRRWFPAGPEDAGDTINGPGLSRPVSFTMAALAKPARSGVTVAFYKDSHLRRGAGL
jgi:hypothetical protein